MPRAVLFALTGMGNVVLAALCEAGRRPLWVVTRQETGPYPYYAEEPLTELAKRLGVPCLVDAKGEEKVATEPPDVLICATYHRILRPPLLRRAAWAVNLHPSLLPRYRGPNPFHWVIRNGEVRSGVTAHIMTERADAGPIVWSEAIELAPDETQGSLRWRLASVAARGAIAMLQAVKDDTIAPVRQVEDRATAFPRPPESDRVLCADWTVEEADRRIRAFAPFPGVTIGTYLACGVISREPPSRAPVGTVIAEAGDRCRLRLTDGDIVVRLSRTPRS